MRILHIVPDLDPLSGGTTAYVVALAREQLARGDKPHILTLDQGGRTPSLSARELGLTALTSTRIKYRYAAGLRSWIRENSRNFDCAMIHGLWQYHCYGSAMGLRETGLPYFIFPHGMLDPWFKHQHPLKHLKKWCYWPWAEFRALASAQAVIFTTEAERIKARESFWLYSVLETVVSLGIEEPEIFPEETENFFGKFPAAKDRRLILFLGRIHPKKGVDILIQSFAQTLREEFRLVLAGPCDESYRSSLTAIARSLHVDHRIIWTGMLDGAAKAAALATAEVFVLPSHSENFGIAVVEALAAKCPVIISDKVDIHDAIRDTKSGLVCKDTVEGLSAAFTEWRELSSSEREKIGSNGRRCFEEKFTIRHSADLLGEVVKHPPDIRFRGWLPMVFYAISMIFILFFLCEIGLRVAGVMDQPLFRRDGQLGYVVAPAQSGAFLNQNRWEFNKLSMGAGPYDPAGHVNILLVGNSVIYGGNPLDQPQKPGPQLQSLAGGRVRVWPMATSGWHTGNEIAFLKKNGGALQNADALVWQLDSGDFDGKSSWSDPFQEPIHPPLIATWFLFGKYIIPRTWDRVFPPPGEPITKDMIEKNFQEFQKFIRILRARHPVLVILLAWYPQKVELLDAPAADRALYEKYGGLLKDMAQPPMLRFVDIAREPEWNAANYRDFIHENAVGSRVLAAIFLRELKKSLPLSP